ncbi:MAG: HAD family hydrolase [Halobacteriovoraceae bacterium]|nr:HAD family hydrolase [Halobacteriovoraceae bacterium]
MEFKSWFEYFVNSSEKDWLSSWEPVFKIYFENFKEHLRDSHFFLNQPLVEKREDHHWSYWFYRALKRESSEISIFDNEKDEFRGLGFFMTNQGSRSFQDLSNFAPLAMTPAGKNRALFLDRDGIINVDEGYVSSPDKLIFVEGIENLIKYCNEQEILVIVLTNQSGVGRGYYLEEDVLKLHEFMEKELLKKGAKVNAWYFSPFHPESEKEEYKRVSLTRKPRPGMALKAAYDLSIDIEKSAMMGDKVSDILSHIDLHTILFKGNYELGGFQPMVENHAESLKILSAYFQSTK